MEEILASIRRIIEDNESAHEAEAGAPAPQTANDEAGSAGGAQAEMESFRSEFGTDEGSGNASADRTVVTGKAFANASPRGPSAAAAETEQEGDDDALAGMTAASSWPDAPTPDAPTSAEAPGESGDAPEGANDPASATHSAAATEDGALSGAAAAGTNGATPPPADIESRPAIISEVAERKVAAAFEELNDAFEASRRKSFDEMAEEMLRPMLQDWLDNNLPTLVEKLVREEIERVARGESR